MIKRFSEISNKDINTCWWKWASLGEMTQAGLPVPNGFVLTTKAFWLNSHKRDDEVLHAFDELNCKFVAVRSSGTKEDGIDDSFAGQFDTYLFVTKEKLIEQIIECHNSINSDRIVSYCKSKKINHDEIKVAVVIQKMINSDVAGICFTINPVTWNNNEIIIEAGYGLGEAVVSWMITPDNYIINKISNEITKNISEQTRKIVLDINKWWTKEEKVESTIINIQKLSDKHILELTKLAKKIEKHYRKPMDTEWAVENGKLYMLQARPVTTIEKKHKVLNQNYNRIKVVERQNSPLFLNFICNGITDYYTKKVLWTKLGYDFYVYLNGEVYITTESSNKIKKKFNSLLSKKGLKAIEYFLEKWYIIWNRLIKDSKESKKNLKIDNKKIAKTFSKITEEYYSLSSALMLIFPIEEYLEREIKNFLIKKNRKNIEEDLITLTQPNKKNENELENESLNKILEIVKKENIPLKKPNKKIDTLISKHINKFGWTNTDRFFNERWSKDDIINRLSSKFQEKSKKPTNENNEKLYKNLRFSSYEKKIIKIAKEYVFFRTYRMNTFMKAAFFLRDILYEIANRLNVWFSEITYMTPEEIIKALNKEKKISTKEIKKRLIEYWYYVMNNNIKTISGEKYKSFKKKYFIKTEKKSHDEIKWIVAYNWKIKGIVKIVKSTSDLHKVKHGDILVTPMTIPSFVSAMEKASAFITDEWGILCHAAIISREMKKPCIIWTKIATKKLKDGDLVEVDANSGIILLLNKKK